MVRFASENYQDKTCSKGSLCKNVLKQFGREIFFDDTAGVAIGLYAENECNEENIQEERMFLIMRQFFLKKVCVLKIMKKKIHKKKKQGRKCF